MNLINFAEDVKFHLRLNFLKKNRPKMNWEMMAYKFFQEPGKYYYYYC